MGAWGLETGDRGETGPVQPQPSLTSPALGVQISWNSPNIQNCDGRENKEETGDKYRDKDLAIYDLW